MMDTKLLKSKFAQLIRETLQEDDNMWEYYLSMCNDNPEFIMKTFEETFGEPFFN